MKALIGRYHTRADFLRGLADAKVKAHPEEEVRRRIVEMKNYIEEARKLAYKHYKIYYN